MSTGFKNTPLSTLYNYCIIISFVIAPFLGFITRVIFDFYFNYVMIMLCFISIYFIVMNKIEFKIASYVLFFIIFVIYTFFSDIIIVGRKVDFKYFYSNFLIGSVLILLIIENTIISKKFFNLIFILNHVVLFIAFIVIIIQQFGDRLFFVNPEFHQILTERSYSNTRLPSIYSWIGSTSALGLCFFPILGLTISHHLKNKYKGIFYLYLIGIIVAFISKSRFIMLNYILLFALIPIYRGINFKLVLRYLMIFIIFILVSYHGSKFIGLDTDKIINERVLETNKGGILSGTASTRLLAFEIFNRLYFKTPIFGKGRFHSIGDEGIRDNELIRLLRRRSSHIHVGYLSLFYYYGLIGGIIYLLFLFFITKETYKGARLTNCWGPFFAILQFLITNLTGTVLNVFITGIIIALVYHKYYTQDISLASTQSTQ